VTSDRRRTADGPSPELERARAVATIVDTGCDGAADVSRIAEDLCARGINRLMVEGGGTVLTQFLTADLVDELHLVVAPMFVGDSRAPRLVGDGRFPWNPDRRADLAGVRQIGDVALLRYALSERFCAEHWAGGVRGPDLPDAAIRTQVPVHLQLPDGYATTALVSSFQRTRRRSGAPRSPARHPHARPAGPAAR
jgi:hypothetical protein